MPEPLKVQSMFDRIAGRYDLLNRIMTMGIDKRWRREAVRAAGVSNETVALDVCCGTGDLTFLLAKAGAARVVGADFSANMLQQARKRAQRSSDASRIQFVEADALALPFSDDEFDSLTIGFGVRNVENLATAFTEFHRVVKPGGRIVCLEITRPKRRLSQSFYQLWFHRIVPKVGALISGDAEAYSYLPESTKSFPQPAELAQLMRSCGLSNVRFKLFAGGIVAIHSAHVPISRGINNATPTSIPTSAMVQK